MSSCSASSNCVLSVSLSYWWKDLWSSHASHDHHAKSQKRRPRSEALGLFFFLFSILQSIILAHWYLSMVWSNIGTSWPRDGDGEAKIANDFLQFQVQARADILSSSSRRCRRPPACLLLLSLCIVTGTGVYWKQKTHKIQMSGLASVQHWRGRPNGGALIR